MLERKNPVNLGVIVGDQVLYTSDMEIKNVLDLSRFSISFATNLVKDARLLGFMHEPNEQGHVEGGGITREHVNFTFLTGRGGDDIALCCTYPSHDDLKALGIADITVDQLHAQAKAFLDAFTRCFDTESTFINVPFSALPQDKLLKFHQLMYELYQETIQASNIIFLDQYPDPSVASMDVLPDPEGATFLFASVMHGSVPCASRFFETMDGFFKITVDEGTENIQSIIENLISAQLSTIITTARAIAGTMIRQVELLSGGETILITFYPIKNEYSLALISKGSPTTLRFFTEATAAVLSGFEVLDGPFSGDLSSFNHVSKMLHDIPLTIQEEEHMLELDDVLEDMDFEIVTTGKSRRQRKPRGEKKEDLDEMDVAFEHERPALEKAIVEFNEAIQQGKAKKVARVVKTLVDLAGRSGNRMLKDYFSNKQATLSRLEP